MRNFILRVLPFHWLTVSIIIVASALQTMKGQIIWQSVNAINRDVQYVGSTSIVIIGDHGKIIRSDDDGQKWRWQESYVRANFHSLHFVDKTVGCVSGDSGIVVFTVNSGTTWSKTIVGANIPIRGVQMLSKVIAVGVGDSGVIYRTDDRGRVWTPIHSPTTNNLRSVCFTNAELGVAVGDSGIVLRTTDGGLSWTSIIIKPDISCTNVCFFNSSIGMISGLCRTDTLYGTAGLMFRTDNGGMSWTQVDSSITYRPRKITFSDSLHTFAAGYPTVVRRTSDGGTSWITDTIDFTYFFKPFNSVVDMNGISFLPNGKGCLIGEKGCIALTKDSGTRWDIHSYNQVQAEDLFFKALSNVVMTDGDNGVFFGSGGLIFQTYDGGVTSIRRSPLTSDNTSQKFDADAWWAGGHFTSKTDGIVVGYEGSSKNRGARTSDGGKTWNYSPEIQASRLYFSSTMNGFATYQNFPLRITDDGGKTWKSKPLGTKNDYLGAIHFPTVDTGFIISNYTNLSNPDTTSPFRLFRTTDGGKSFDTVYSSPIQQKSMTIFFTDGLHGYMAGRNAGNSMIFHTTDGGKSWEDTPLPFNVILSNISFIDKNLGFVVGYMDTLIYTTNGGQSWLFQKISNDIPSLGTGYSRVKAVNDSTIFLLGTKRFIRCIIPKELRTSVDSPHTSEGRFNPYFYIRTQPIPASGMMEVTLYGLYSVKNQLLTVKVFNMLGFEVADYSSEANAGNNGAYSTFNADVGKLGGGVYVLQYSAGGYTKSGLFVVAR